jgi:hypothetical protein
MQMMRSVVVSALQLLLLLGLQQYTAAAIVSTAAAGADAAAVTTTDNTLSDERVVFQTQWGDVEFAFLPHVSVAWGRRGGGGGGVQWYEQSVVWFCGRRCVEQGGFECGQSKLHCQQQLPRQHL